MNLKCFLIAMLFILSSNIFGQDTTLVKTFDKANNQGGDVTLNKSSIKIEGNNTYRIFEIEAPEDGDYYFSSWLMAAQTKEGYLAYDLQINGEKIKFKMRPEKSNWQTVKLIDDNRNQKTVKLIKGINTIAFMAFAPEVPEVEFIRLSKVEVKADISDKKYLDFIGTIKDEVTKRGSSPVEIRDTLSPSLKSGVVLDNPSGNYFHHIGVSFRYTTYKTILLFGGEQVVVTTSGSNGYQHVLELFSQIYPESYSWVALSNSTGATLSITVPRTGFYYVKVRSYIQETEGLVNLNISTQANGNYYYANCAVSGSGFTHVHDTPESYNYFTSYVTGDSFIWIEDNSGTPGKIRAFNDNYSGSGDYAWGLASRVKKDFSVSIASALISSSSSNNPTGICDVYIMCKNSPTDIRYPNLKSDDAIISAEQSDWYNCAAWGGGLTNVGSMFPYGTFGNPWDGGSTLATLDNCYGNVRADGSPLPRWAPADCPTYTRNGANLANAEIALFGSLAGIQHVAVTKYANNQPHGYSWESKLGSGYRIFHYINSFNGSSFGAICGYYTRVSQLKSQRIGDEELSFEESIKRGSTVLDVVNYSTLEQTKISKLQGMIPDNEKLVFEYLFSALKTNWDSTDKSNLSIIAAIINTKEYHEALNYFFNKPDNRCLLYNKIDEADGLAIMLLGDISKKKNETLMDEVLSENFKNQYTKDGAYIAPSIYANVKKYVKKILENTNEKGILKDAQLQVTTNEVNNNSFSVYPNPANSEITVSFNLTIDSKVSLLITDLDSKTKSTLLTGEVLLSGSHKMHLDSSNFKTGVYFVKLIIDGNINVQKLVIIK